MARVSGSFPREILSKLVISYLNPLTTNLWSVLSLNIGGLCSLCRALTTKGVGHHLLSPEYIFFIGHLFSLQLPNTLLYVVLNLWFLPLEFKCVALAMRADYIFLCMKNFQQSAFDAGHQLWCCSLITGLTAKLAKQQFFASLSLSKAWGSDLHRVRDPNQFHPT